MSSRNQMLRGGGDHAGVPCSPSVVLIVHQDFACRRRLKRARHRSLFHGGWIHDGLVLGDSVHVGLIHGDSVHGGVVLEGSVYVGLVHESLDVDRSVHFDLVHHTNAYMQARLVVPRVHPVLQCGGSVQDEVMSDGLVHKGVFLKDPH